MMRAIFWIGLLLRGPRGGEIVEIADGLAVDEEGVEGFGGEVVEAELPLGAVDLGAEGEIGMGGAVPVDAGALAGVEGAGGFWGGGHGF